MLSAAARRLDGVSDTPRLDAELLMAHALGTTREAVLMRHLRAAAPANFDALLRRRLAHEPVAYITGTRDFWTIRLTVTPDVLIPRADSETLIEAAVRHFGTSTPARVLDLGTGSGALLLAALDQWPGATGLGIDASADALAVAAGNARALGLDDRAEFRLGDWAAGIDARFDLVLCNPPYVEDAAALPGELAYEPAAALFAGADGLDCYRVLAPQLPTFLAAGGVACIEVGSTQAEMVGDMMRKAGMIAEVLVDLGGHPRCLTLRG